MVWWGGYNRKINNREILKVKFKLPNTDYSDKTCSKQRWVMIVFIKKDRDKQNLNVISKFSLFCLKVLPYTLPYLIPKTTFLKCRKHAYFTVKRIKMWRDCVTQNNKANKWWGKDVNMGFLAPKAKGSMHHNMMSFWSLG